MSANSTNLRRLVPAGFATWALVGAPQIVSMVSTGTVSTFTGIAWLSSFAGFGVAFFLATRDDLASTAELALVAVQSLLALACVGLQPDGFQPVLLVIVAVHLGKIPLLAGLTWTAIQSLLLGVVLISTGVRAPFAMTLAYFGFQLFAIFVTRIALEEQRAKQALAETNTELRVATGLLEINSRTEERLRIARDLHDLLGHHLTALSLNLEVASHLTNEAARERIEKSQDLIRILLADLRDVVGKFRNREPVDLRSALVALRETVHSPSLKIEGDEIVVVDPAIARTLLRVIQEAVTNSIRHSSARNLWLSLSQNDSSIGLVARDDGSGTDSVEFGSGLEGMRERVEEAGGSMEVASARGKGFELRITLPHEREP